MQKRSIFGAFWGSFWLPKTEKNDEKNEWIFGEAFLLIFIDFLMIFGLIFESFFDIFNESRKRFKPCENTVKTNTKQGSSPFEINQNLSKMVLKNAMKN